MERKSGEGSGHHPHSDVNYSPMSKWDRDSREFGLKCDARFSPLRCMPAFLPCFVMIIEGVDVGPDSGSERATGSRDEADELLLGTEPLWPPPLLKEEDDGMTDDVDWSRRRFDAADSFSHRSKKRAPDKWESARLGMSLAKTCTSKRNVSFPDHSWKYAMKRILQ